MCSVRLKQLFPEVLLVLEAAASSNNGFCTDIREELRKGEGAFCGRLAVVGTQNILEEVFSLLVVWAYRNREETQERNRGWKVRDGMNKREWKLFEVTL